MAFPTILFNTSTGSDTAASGAGPGTALFGTSASFSGSVFTLDGTPDLSGVATDGSHLIWVATSTGRQFFTINAVDDGADTATVDDAPAGTTTGLTWGLGGERNDMNATANRLLFTADLKPGWILEPEDNQSLSSNITISVAGDATNRITLRGASGAIRTITQTANDRIFIMSAADWFFDNLKFQNSNGTKTATEAFRMNSAGLFSWRNCEFGDVTNTLLYGILRNTNAITLSLVNCEVHHCTVHGLSLGQQVRAFLHNVDIHDNVSHGVLFGGDFLEIVDGLLYDNGADGVNLTANDWSISKCTIDGNTGDGIECSSAGCVDRSSCFNNNITANGGWGIKGPASHARKYFWDFNNFGTGGTANTLGASENIPIGDNSLEVDPGYTAAGSGDFSVGANVKAKGSPDADAVIGIGSTTTSFVDIGGAQREEPAGGGGGGSCHILGG